MADQKRWFKVWTSILVDMDDLPDDTIGKWVRLGCRVALVGNSGSVVFASTEHLAHFLRVPTDCVEKTISSLPHVALSVTVDRSHAQRDEAKKDAFSRYGEVTVTLKNWRKYQEDTTAAARMKTLRSKKRGEESSKNKQPDMSVSVTASTPNGSLEARPVDAPDEPAHEPRHAANEAHTTAGPHPDGFVRFWAEYPRKIGRPRASKAWRSMKLERTSDAVLEGVERWRTWWSRQQTPTDRIPYPASWLNDRRWEDDPGEAVPADPYVNFPRGAPC